jgi:hypothetical protein
MISSDTESRAAQAEVVAHLPVDRLVAEARRTTGDVHPQGAVAALDDACGRDRQVAGVVFQLGSPVPTVT